MATRTLCLSVLAFAWWVVPLPARADHFGMDLEIKAPKASKIAHAEVAAPGVKPKPRGVVHAKVGDKLIIKWTLTSTAKKRIAKDVIVHLLVVEEEKAGQVAVPDTKKKPAVAETAMSMDFKPKDKAAGDLSVQIDKPGAYLVRLETITPNLGAEDHDHFAALDLVIE